MTFESCKSVELKENIRLDQYSDIYLKWPTQWYCTPEMRTYYQMISVTFKQSYEWPVLAKCGWVATWKRKQPFSVPSNLSIATHRP